MGTADRLVTAEELLLMPSDEPCELVAGKVVPTTFGDCMHGQVVATVGAILGDASGSKRLGFLAVNAGFVLARDPDTVRAADVAFVRRDRMSTVPKGYFPGPPDLAVEVVSCFDRLGDVDSKAKAWVDAGTPLVWVVYPVTRSVVIHRPGQPPRILHEQGIITGEEVLPGFQCRVAEFFDD